MNIWYMQFILGMREKVIAMAMTFDGSKIKFQARRDERSLQLFQTDTQTAITLCACAEG